MIASPPLTPNDAKPIQRGSARRVWLTAVVLLLGWLLSPAALQAANESEAERAVLALSKPFEEAGFNFRADIWTRELDADVGKAVRIQMFKGNEYRVCVAVSPASGVQLTAHVLDSEQVAVEDTTEVVNGGAWGIILHVKPKRTGIYLFVVREAGKGKKTPCAMITGYK